MLTGEEAYKELEGREIEKYQDVGDLIFHMGERKYINEESTKQGLILPYLKLLGFNYINVNEIQPEFGIEENNKEIGKLDYLIKVEENFHLLEAKKLGKSLTKYIGQLKKYFDNLNGSELGILSDGNHYLFFTDLKVRGVMDETPFLCLGIINNNRNERVTFFSDLYKYTRFNGDYISRKLNGMDIEYNKKYNEVMKRMKELIDKGLITKKEINGLSHLMKINI